MSGIQIRIFYSLFFFIESGSSNSSNQSGSSHDIQINPCCPVHGHLINAAVHSTSTAAQDEEDELDFETVGGNQTGFQTLSPRAHSSPLRRSTMEPQANRPDIFPVDPVSPARDEGGSTSAPSVSTTHTVENISADRSFSYGLVKMEESSEHLTDIVQAGELDLDIKVEEEEYEENNVAPGTSSVITDQDTLPDLTPTHASQTVGLKRSLQDTNDLMQNTNDLMPANRELSHFLLISQMLGGLDSMGGPASRCVVCDQHFVQEHFDDHLAKCTGLVWRSTERGR